MELDKRIVDFLKKHHVLTLSTSVDNKPYSANCFYTYDEKENLLIFTSDKETKHIQDVMQNNFVSGSIVLETTFIGKIQGIQFNGNMFESVNENYKKHNIEYLKRFPFAVLNNTPLWHIELTFIKFTDNRLGFGKKLIWQK
jgi:hypothetical protein